MARYAVVRNSVVENIVRWDGVTTWANSSLAVLIPNGVPVEYGWTYDAGVFAAPVVPIFREPSIFDVIRDRVAELETKLQNTIDIAKDRITALETANSRIRSGIAVVLSGTSSTVVALPAAADGKPATATLNASDGNIAVRRCTWDGSGNLTITLTANTTANRNVGWIVDGR